MRPIGEWRKAIASGIGAALAAAVPVVTDGAMSPADWCIVAGAAMVGFNLTYWTPNDKAPQAPPKP